MKKLKFIKKMVLLLMLCLMPGVFSFAQDEAVDPLQEQLKLLTDRLSLTQEQVTRVEKVFNMAHGQALKDRETFKDNPEALIEAAKRRRSMTDIHIGNIISEEQIEKWNRFKRQRMKKWEFFMIKEGLVLNRQESEAIEDIIDMHRLKMEEMREQMRDRMGGGGPGGRGGGMRGGGMRGGGKMGGGMRGGGMSGGRANPMDKMEDQKNDEIKKVLTIEQWKQYKKIRKLIKAEKEKFRKNMRERMHGR